MITFTLFICSIAHWVYWLNSGNIEVCALLPVERQQEVIAHELGHKFWFEKMTQEERDEWTALRNSLLFTHLYYHENPSVEEDFANNIQEMYHDKKCSYPEICELTKRIIERK